MKGFRPHVIADQLRWLCNAARLRVPAFTVITRIQDCTPGEQILGTAVALRAMCQGANINLSDVMQMSSNVMADVDGPFSGHIRAIREYAQNQIGKGEDAHSRQRRVF